MSIFNDKLAEALFTHNYICSECGAKMHFEDEMEDILVCDKCGHSVELDDYGSEDEESYEELYEDDLEGDEDFMDQFHD